MTKGHNEPVRAFSRVSALVNNFNRAGLRATEGTLRLETALASSASYTFQINQNQSQVVTAISLRQGDAFVATSIGLFLKKAGSSTSPTDAEQAVANLHTFADPTVFTGSGEAVNLNSIYNSTLQLNINNNILTQSLDTLRYKRVATAQQGLAVSTAASNNAYFQSGWDSADYGFMTFNQAIAFNGQANNSVSLTLPTGVNCAGTSSVNYAVLMFRGVLIINGAEMVKDASMKSFIR